MQTGEIILTGDLEKCSDGKRAAGIGDLKGTWEARYFVLTATGLWWFKSEEDYERITETGGKAQGSFDHLGSCDLNYDSSAQWFQICTPDRVLSLRPVDRWTTVQDWIDIFGDKTNLGIDMKEAKKAMRSRPGSKAGVETSGEHCDLLVTQNGVVVSDMGTSLHAAGQREVGASLDDEAIGLNEDVMIGYLSKGDRIELKDWPDKRVEIDSYGYPNVRIEVIKASDYVGEEGYVELKACTFGT